MLGVQVRQTLQSQSSWSRIPGDTLMARTPNCILNSLLSEPLQVSWIANGSDVLVLTDANSRCCFQEPAAVCHGYRLQVMRQCGTEVADTT